MVGLAPSPAAGNPVAEKRAEAQRIATEVARLDHEIEVAAEDFNAANAELAEIRTRMDAVRAAIAQTEVDLIARQQELHLFAVQAYIQGGHSDSLTDLLGSDVNELGARQGYLTATVGDRQQAIDALEATREDITAKNAELARAEAEAGAVTARLEARKQAAEAAEAEQRALLDQAQGELAELVRQEQARRVTTTSRRAAERQRAAAAAPKPAGGGAAPAPNGGAATAIATAMAQIGVPYRWGGASPSGFDCSGLTQYAWAAAGVSLPHNSGQQYNSTRHVPLAEIQPGDLVFYGRPIHHVGLYIGNEQIVHAPNSGQSVKVSSLYWVGNPVGVGRVG